MDDPFEEQLAAIEHRQWADWMRYFFTNCSPLPDGSLVIPAGYVKALQRQIDTPYAELNDVEKEADRDEVARYRHLIEPKAVD